MRYGNISKRVPPLDTEHGTVTIDSWLEALGRKFQDPLDCPIWPPDLFAICGSLLKRSGAYLQVFDRGPSKKIWDITHSTGRKWREQIDKSPRVSLVGLKASVPKEVRSSWQKLIDAKAISLSNLHEDTPVVHELISLAIIADEASPGIGINTKQGPFLGTAQTFLEANRLVSFAWDVPTDVICVLGKQHTPQRGATFRSVTHHLSLYWPNDIEGRWIGPYGRGINEKAPDTVNLLLLPWPEVVETDDFRLARGPQKRSQIDSNYFDYSPARPEKLPMFRRRFAQAIDAARLHARHLDAVVLPEVALTLDQYLAAELIALQKGVMLITGLRAPASLGQSFNYCAIQPAGLLCPPKERQSTRNRAFKEKFVEKFRFIQSKHHRWCLDGDQIVHYQLSGSIPTVTSVWENIHLASRSLYFLTLGTWMTWSVLICEDLARQDPAADLIRAVGPNLLIALLLDGPQLRGRWPSRYASVLAEDPGTSVLTLTSLGMAERCRPVLQATRQRAPATRAIALWRDMESGEHEIVLDKDDNACVLSLVRRSATELSADGRGDQNQAHSPVFAGYKTFRIDG